MKSPLKLKPRLPALIVLALLGGTAVGPARADWLGDLLKRAQDLQVAPATGQAASALTDEEVIRGLREALAQGTRQAVAQLGQEGGYLNNLKVKIPMPEGLQKVEKALRALKQDKYADQFVATLNHAAERAAPEAAAIFADSLAKMSLEDARGILKGPDDAATQYFRRTSEAQLKEKFLPVIQRATDQAGVTSAYKSLLQKAGPYAMFLGQDSTDLDGYVTGKALDGLFRMVAEEEKRIRQDPLARGTDLLKKVFGSLAR
ncbi:MAG: DUF4197 domain-containing protein [Thiobacillaceae bacterium]|jgi:hypothetical protein|nr:DUF4197 domain-containing protein [Thiobacillaceae bacterium]